MGPGATCRTHLPTAPSTRTILRRHALFAAESLVNLSGHSSRSATGSGVLACGVPANVEASTTA